MVRFQPGFIAKKDVKDYFFVGPIASGLNCLFVNREEASARQQIVCHTHITYIIIYSLMNLQRDKKHISKKK